MAYLDIIRSRGRDYAYYRRGTQRVPLPSPIGGPEFLAKYQEVHASFEAPGRPPLALGSLAALIAEFKMAPEFTELSDETRRGYLRHMEALAELSGVQVDDTTRPWALIMRDSMRATPRNANYRMTVLCRLLNFAIDRGCRANNPATRIKPLKTGPGYRPWTEAEVSAFLTFHPQGPMHLALMLGLYLGQRRGDVVHMGWSQYDGQAVEVVQSKTGARLWIPAHPDLRRALEKTPMVNVAILTDEAGRPFNVHRFSRRFKAATDGCAFR